VRVRRSIPAACRGCPTGSRGKRIRTRSAARGFWAGGDTHPEPIFYSYAYPSPPGFAEARAAPAAAHWHNDLAEFVLPYEAMRTGGQPRADLMAFLESTYTAAAELGGWDRARLEWQPGQRPGVAGRTRHG
jgi:hypothetical protein